MRLSRFLIVLILLCTGSTVPGAYAQQKEISGTDSLEGPTSREGKNAKSDEIYFRAIQAKIHDDYRQARTLFEQFAEQRPEVAATYYELCNLSYDDKQVDKAQEYIRKAISLDKTNKWYKEEYASILADHGSLLEAADVMAELCKMYPDDADYAKAAAEYYTQAKKYKQALPYIDKALLANEGDEDLMQRKMKIYLGMNDVEKAADVVRQMIAGDPNNGKYYVLLGDLYDNNKMTEKATAVYEKAQKVIPNDGDLQAGIAGHYLKTGDTAAYIARMQKAIVNKDQDAETQLDMLTTYIQRIPNDSVLLVQGMPVIRQLVAQHPEDDQVLAVYGGFLELANQHDSAAWAYEKSIQIKPSEFNVWLKLLNMYTGKQYADSLIKYSDKFIRLFPNQADAHYFSAIGHGNKGDYAGAIKAVNRAIDYEPDNNKPAVASLYAYLGELYHNNKQDDQSDKAFDKALTLNPDDASVLNNYSYFLSERGARLDDAEKMSAKSLALKPGEGTYLDTYGWILYKKGNYEKAKEYVQRAIQLAAVNTDGTLYDHLGNILYKLNDKDKAVQNWRFAKEKNSDDPLLDKKISEGKLYE